MAEAMSHPVESIFFVTLTYDEEHVPVARDGQVTLDKSHGRLFRARVRDALGYQPRFFWVGEYGEQTGRPHYHVMLYGLMLPFSEAQEFLQKHWPHGHVDLRPWSEAYAAYISRYVLKKRTKRKDADDIPEGSRLPEYSQMSRRPALGDVFVKQIATVQEHHVAQTGDVSSAFRWQGKIMPLGDRHKRLLRREVGIPELVTKLKELNPHKFPPPEPVSEKSIKAASVREKQIEKRAKIRRGPRL